MGWGTDFTANIFLNKVSYNTKDDVQDAIEDLQLEIVVYEQQIMMFASSTPKDIIPEDWKDNSIGFLFREINTLLREYNENLNNLFRLRLYLEHLNENNITKISKQE